MNDALRLLEISAAVLAVLYIFYFAWRFFFDFTRLGGASRKPAKKKNAEEKAPCPLCNSKLYKDDNLVSRVYKTSTPNDLPCSIHGCPHCYPVPEEGIKRVCPVCRKEVPVDGHLDAHLFTRRSGKKHVHVTGCTECHKKNES